MKIPETVEQWREFMNGYRDPKTNEAERARLDTLDPFGDIFPGTGERECGNRKEGGTYATCPLSPDGKPLEHFVVCKPVPIDPKEYNLANVGVKLVDLEELCGSCHGEPLPKKSKFQKYTDVCPVCHGTGRETVTHVFDIVGQEYYPNVADFLEEARRIGVSRRLELEDARQYARLSKRSRLMLLHHRAIIRYPGDRLVEMLKTEFMRLCRAGCTKGLEEHHLTLEGDFGHLSKRSLNKTAPGCSALHWHMIEKGEAVPEQGKPEGFVERRLKSGSYRGYKMPEGYEPDFDLGIFAVFPLVEIQVIDPDGSYQDRVRRAGNARLDVEAVEC